MAVHKGNMGMAALLCCACWCATGFLLHCHITPNARFSHKGGVTHSGHKVFSTDHLHPWYFTSRTECIATLRSLVYPLVVYFDPRDYTNAYLLPWPGISRLAAMGANLALVVALWAAWYIGLFQKEQPEKEKDN
eukprot:NODE_3409_length_778_cov_47.417010_g2849_i0.p1 GENE.NODE_3409_length_778_cov_47.417010_g2849_i0~~NODE_3409_length_778_cov_47.417010_g2849_i0.p1  ORF type:complete len:134 (-),score=21.38 NODE_3409_length_778_cov_47.417010_g2849_i0:250-651(-)